jgi:hypothetical protein
MNIKLKRGLWRFKFSRLATEPAAHVVGYSTKSQYLKVILCLGSIDKDPRRR